jgi:hypothetical protein
MPIPSSRATRLAYTFLYVALTCVGAIQLFHLAMEQYAISSFWHRWVVEYPIAGTYLPYAAIALVCGVLVGFVVGALAGPRSWSIAGWAGVAVCVLSVITAIAVGGIEWVVTNPALLGPVFTAVGLLLGASVGRKIRHA